MAERAGHIVSREELSTIVWPSTVVEESSLRVHVAALRKALGDGQGSSRFIINVPGRGYCFVAGVRQVPDHVDADEVWTFGDYELSPRRRLLKLAGRPVKLGSRAIELLVALTRKSGEVQRRESLIAEIWGRDVDDGNLRVHIASLRRALGDATDDCEFIASEPGVGYRFVAPVSRRSVSLSGESTPPANLALRNGGAGELDA
ncbi:MAG: transcriptional regulator [Ramlibacter sp.]|nr:transcriptional regulator [Ramlibacter sp.]